MGKASHISDYHLLPATRSKARDNTMIILTSLVAASSPIPLLAPVKTTVRLVPTPFATVGPARSAAKAAPAAVFPKPALVTNISSPPSFPLLLLLLLLLLEKSAVSADDIAAFPRAAVGERGICGRGVCMAKVRGRLEGRVVACVRAVPCVDQERGDLVHKDCALFSPSPALVPSSCLAIGPSTWPRLSNPPDVTEMSKSTRLSLVSSLRTPMTAARVQLSVQLVNQLLSHITRFLTLSTKQI